MDEVSLPPGDPDSEPVTRKVLREELSKFATKDDLTTFATKDDLTKFATKEDLSRFATKEDLSRFATKEDLSRFATKEDLDKLDVKVETYFGALHERLVVVEKTLATVVTMLQALPAEIARQIRALDEQFRGYLTVIDDKYKDLPERVSRLETLANQDD